MRPRAFVFFAGLTLCALATVPLWLLYAALTLGGGWAILAGLGALLSAPLLWLWFLGPRVLMFAIRGIPIEGGNIWRWRARSAPEDDGTIEGEFERQT